MSAPSASSGDLNKILVAARLPALPQSAIKVMELARDPNNGPPQLAVPIEADPGLTGQVLRFLNSSYFGFANEISSVKLAITMVGVRTIKNFVLWSAVFSLLPNPRCGPFDVKTLWQDSLRRGLFARLLSKRMGRKESEDAFAAALLQDMAVPLLAKALPNDYIELLNERGEGRRRLSELEQERFGWNHAQAAGIVARQWHFPEEFALLVENHIQPPVFTAGESLSQALQGVISLSALLPSAVDSAWFEFGTFEQALGTLPLEGSPPTLDVLAQTDVEFAELAPILKLERPIRPLVEFYQEAAPALQH